MLNLLEGTLESPPHRRLQEVRISDLEKLAATFLENATVTS